LKRQSWVPGAQQHIFIAAKDEKILPWPGQKVNFFRIVTGRIKTEGIMNRQKTKSLPVAAHPVSVFHAYTKLPSSKKAILKTAVLIYKAEKIPSARATHVILCSDRAIHRLNASFRHKNRPTDVLSFCYDEPDLLGEIYISLQRAKVQAKEYGVSLANEIQRLFVHGMFHLLGHDHEKESEAKRMRRKERFYVT
jgi:probable rRNA maturation factor